MLECDLCAQKLFCSGIRYLDSNDIFFREHIFWRYPLLSLDHLGYIFSSSCIANVGKDCAINIYL